MRIRGRHVQKLTVTMTAKPQATYSGALPAKKLGKKHNLRHHVNPFCDLTSNEVAVYHAALIPGSMWLSAVPLKPDWNAQEGDECNVHLTYDGDGNKLCGIDHMMLYIGPQEVERIAKDRKSGRNVVTKDIIHTFLLRDRIVAPWTLSLVKPV
jgi:hypothetical protein